MKDERYHVQDGADLSSVALENGTKTSGWK